MSEEPSDTKPLAEDSRIDALEARLAAAKRAEEARTGTKIQGQDESTRLGNRVLADLIGGIAGGLFIGWVIDHFAGTSPWGLLVMLFAGIGVAFRNIIRMSTRRPE